MPIKGTDRSVHFGLAKLVQVPTHHIKNSTRRKKREIKKKVHDMLCSFLINPAVKELTDIFIRSFFIHTNFRIKFLITYLRDKIMYFS